MLESNEELKGELNLSDDEVNEIKTLVNNTVEKKETDFLIKYFKDSTSDEGEEELEEEDSDSELDFSPDDFMFMAKNQKRNTNNDLNSNVENNNANENLEKSTPEYFGEEACDNPFKFELAREFLLPPFFVKGQEKRVIPKKDYLFYICHKFQMYLFNQIEMYPQNHFIWLNPKEIFNFLKNIKERNLIISQKNNQVFDEFLGIFSVIFSKDPNNEYLCYPNRSQKTKGLTDIYSDKLFNFTKFQEDFEHYKNSIYYILIKKRIGIQQSNSDENTVKEIENYLKSLHSNHKYTKDDYVLFKWSEIQQLEKDLLMNLNIEHKAVFSGALFKINSQLKNKFWGIENTNEKGLKLDVDFYEQLSRKLSTNINKKNDFFLRNLNLLVAEFSLDIFKIGDTHFKKIIIVPISQNQKKLLQFEDVEIQFVELLNHSLNDSSNGKIKNSNSNIKKLGQSSQQQANQSSITNNSENRSNENKYRDNINKSSHSNKSKTNPVPQDRHSEMVLYYFLKKEAYHVSRDIARVLSNNIQHAGDYRIVFSLNAYTTRTPCLTCTKMLNSTALWNEMFSLYSTQITKNFTEISQNKWITLSWMNNRIDRNIYYSQDDNINPSMATDFSLTKISMLEEKFVIRKYYKEKIEKKYKYLSNCSYYPSPFILFISSPSLKDCEDDLIKLEKTDIGFPSNHFVLKYFRDALTDKDIAEYNQGHHLAIGKNIQTEDVRKKILEHQEMISCYKDFQDFLENTYDSYIKFEYESKMEALNKINRIVKKKSTLLHRNDEKIEMIKEEALTTNKKLRL